MSAAHECYVDFCDFCIIRHVSDYAAVIKTLGLDEGNTVVVV